jgi:4-hydroxy-2-oxoheptanedioate aldolase
VIPRSANVAASTRKSELSSSASITERVRRGESVLGTFLNLGSPLAAEICARAGFDWLLVDLEHGAGTEAELISTLQAIGDRCGTIVRVESSERPRIQRALDAGADGVMVPRVESAAEARAAVSHLRYAPRGDRGVAYMNRGASWTPIGEERELLCVVQIETPGAVDDARDIAAIEGVDVLFVGPNDLSVALGTKELPLAEIVEAARAEGKAAGIFTGSPEDAKLALDRGFRFVAVASDSYFLAQAARAAAS